MGFRNYREQTLAFDPACNVIHGENAQGKTNLLEAIVYLSCGKSPRTRSDRELITFDGQQARITGKIFSRDREFVTDITLQAGRRRKMTVNGVAAKNAAELSDVLHTVFFFVRRICSLSGRGGGGPAKIHGSIPVPAAAPICPGFGGVSSALGAQDPYPAGPGG